MGKKVENQIGAKYGHLTILKDLPSVRAKRGTIRVIEAKCDCGNIGQYHFGRLRMGNTRSCGCIMGKSVRHGLSKTEIYRMWKNLKDRIAKDHRWRNLEMFVEDMNESFELHIKDNGSDFATIRLKDEKLGFVKENCFWFDYKKEKEEKKKLIELKKEELQKRRVLREAKSEEIRKIKEKRMEELFRLKELKDKKLEDIKIKDKQKSKEKITKSVSVISAINSLVEMYNCPVIESALIEAPTIFIPKGYKLELK